MKTKPDPTPKAKPLGEFSRGGGNRKKPAITLPRIRSLEQPEPNERGDPERAAQVFQSTRHGIGTPE